MLRREFMKGTVLSGLALFFPPGWEYIQDQLEMAVQATRKRRLFRTIKDGSWNDPAIWDLRCVPTKDDDVMIRNYITVPSGTTKCHDLTLEAGCMFEAVSESAITLSGGITFNQGSSYAFQRDSSVTVVGDTGFHGTIYCKPQEGVGGLD